MVSLLYNNIDLEVYKTCAISTVSAVAEKSNTHLYDSKQPMRVAAHTSKHKTCIVKLKSGVPEIRAFKDSISECVDSRDVRTVLTADKAASKMFRVGGCC